MAISKDQLTVEVVLDSSGAVKGIKDLEGQFIAFDKVVSKTSLTTNKANESTGKVRDTFSGLSSTLSKAALPLLAVQTAVTAVANVLGTLSDAVGSFIQEYAGAEKAQILLAQAIETTNGRIKNSADAWSEYLDMLEMTKNADADVLKGLVAQAAQMGFSEKQIKSLVDASVGLSIVTGRDLPASFQQVLGTTRGMATTLQTLVPEVAKLTAEQLKSGDAFALIADKYKNAASGAGSFTESAKSLGFVVGGVKEDIGKIIVETFGLNRAMQLTTDTLHKVRAAIASVDMKALGDKFKEFAKVAAPVAAVIGLVILKVTGLGAALAATIAPILLITAKIALIVAAVAAVIAIIEALIRNFDLLDDALVVIGKSILLVLIKPIEMANKAIASFLGLFGDNALSKKWNKTVANITAGVDKLKDEIKAGTKQIKNNFDSGFSGEVIKQATNFVKGFSTETKNANSSLKELGSTGARVKVIDEKAIEAAKNALKDIQKETANLRLQTEQMGASEIDQIHAKTKAQLEAIENKRKELETQGLLNNKIKDALKDNEAAVIAYGQKATKAAEEKAIIEAQRQPLADLKKLHDDSAAAVDNMRMSQLGTFDTINAQASIELQKIDALEKQLEISGALNSENQAALEAARGAVEEMKSAKVGDAIMSGINSAISAAQGGADALVGNIINQIGDAFGPKGKMIAGVVNLLRKGKDFTKKLGKDLVDIIADLPKMLAEGAVGLIEGLTDGLTKLLSDPKRVEGLIQSLVKAMPRVMAALIKALPALIVVLSRPQFWVSVVKAFVKAFIEGTGDMIAGLADAFGDIGKELWNAIQKAVKDLYSALGKLGEFLINAFSKAIEFLFGLLATIGQVIFDGVKWVFQKIADGFSAALDFLGNLGQKLWDGMKWVAEKVGNSFSQAFQFLGNLGQNIWDGVKWVFDKISDAFKGAFSYLGNLGSDIWNAISKGFEGVGNFFKNLFKFDGGGKGGVENFLGFDFPWIAFAEGGIVPGKPKVLGDSSKNDTVPALLSPGEAVIPRSMMKDKGVSSFVNSLFAGERPQGHFLGIPGTESVPWGDKEVHAITDAIAEGVSDVGQWIGDIFVPDNIKQIYDSLSRFISNIDLKRLVTDPLGMITDAIKGSLGFLVEPFRKMMKFNAGGFVPGNGNTDTVPAMLTPGEFVLNKETVQSIGTGFLNRLNNGTASSEATAIFNINLNIETRDSLDTAFIRNTLLPTLKSELKASSLRGDFVLSAKGVR